MNPKIIAYWLTTGLTALVFIGGGIADLRRPPEVLAGMTELGYPAYFLLILGIWKVLGSVAVLVPRFPRLKEWAYAGMFFDLTGAALSHAMSGDPAAKVATPLVLLGLVVASWALRPASRVLTGTATGSVLAETPRAGAGSVPVAV